MTAGRISRRRFAAEVLAASLASACASSAEPAAAGDGSLDAQLGASGSPLTRAGDYRLANWPRPLVFIPEAAVAGTALPMILVLHGGGSNAEWTMGRMLKAARREGVILLAPDARGYTWDAIDDFRHNPGADIARIFGADTERVETSLRLLFSSVAIDPARVGIAGFSDGASYALSLGPRNQQLFTHIMGFSGGGVIPFSNPPRARVFMSHGRQDPMLPFANAEQGIAPGFRAMGYDVAFERFDGVHAFRDEEIDKAMDWFLRS